MEQDYKAQAEKVFQEGMTAHEAGIPLEHCPYQFSDSGITDYDGMRLNWKQGWHFSRLVKVQSYRRKNTEKIKLALEKYKSFQSEFNKIQSVICKGMLTQPFKFYCAKNVLSDIHKKITECAEVKFLRDLYFDMYIWVDDKNIHHFLVKDDILSAYCTQAQNEEGPLRHLVQTYGKKYGVQNAWSEYVHTCTEYTKGYDGHSI